VHKALLVYAATVVAAASSQPRPLLRGRVLVLVGGEGDILDVAENGEGGGGGGWWVKGLPKKKTRCREQALCPLHQNHIVSKTRFLRTSLFRSRVTFHLQSL
jgi:hypothetical protein